MLEQMMKECMVSVADEQKDVLAANGLMDSVYSGLIDMGYAENIADEVAKAARGKLLELCGQSDR